MEKTRQQRDRRQWLHSLGLCTKCKSRDAYTMAGHWLCAECCAAQSEYERIRRASDPERFRDQRKAWRKAKLDAGLCGHCGRRPVVPGRKSCSVCLASYRRQEERKKLRCGKPDGRRGGDGRCYVCNKAQAEPGKRTCAACGELMSRNLRGGRFKQKGDHPWKLDNGIVFANTVKSLPHPGSLT